MQFKTKLLIIFIFLCFSGAHNEPAVEESDSQLFYLNSERELSTYATQSEEKDEKELLEDLKVLLEKLDTIKTEKPLHKWEKEKVQQEATKSWTDLVGQSFLQISSSLRSVIAPEDCQQAAKNSEELNLQTELNNWGCSVRKSAENLGEKAKPIVEHVGSIVKDASYGIYDSMASQKCEELAVIPDTSQTKKRFQQLGCNLRTSAEVVVTEVKPLANNIISSVKNYGSGLLDTIKSTGDLLAEKLGHKKQPDTWSNRISNFFYGKEETTWTEKMKDFAKNKFNLFT